MCRCESERFAPSSSCCESEKIIEKPVCRCEIQRYAVRKIHDCYRKERCCESRSERVCCPKPYNCKPSFSDC